MKQLLVLLAVLAAAVTFPAAAHAVAPPSTIPSDCTGTNAQVALNSWIAGLPNGSTIDFPSNGCYQLDNRIEVQDKAGFTINGNGAEFRTSAPNSGCSVKPLWMLLRTENLIIRDMELRGGFNPPASMERTTANAGSFVDNTGCINGDNQFNAGVGVWGGNEITLRDMDIRNVWGDGVLTATAHYINGLESHPLNLPQNIHIERVTVRTTARHCISPSATNRLWLEDSNLQDCWYGGMDIELDDPSHKASDIHILRNRWNGYSLFAITIPVAGNEPGQVNTDNIQIKDNIFETGVGQPSGPGFVCNAHILVGFYPEASHRTFSNVVVENNTFLERWGWGVWIDHVTSGAVQNNKDSGYVEKGCNYPNGAVPFHTLNEQCRDNVDNDVDGLIDANDPECATMSGDNVVFATNTPTAPGASIQSGTAACSDAQDNDGDGLVDYPNDPGCSALSDADETNASAPVTASSGKTNYLESLHLQMVVGKAPTATRYVQLYTVGPTEAGGGTPVSCGIPRAATTPSTWGAPFATISTAQAITNSLAISFGNTSSSCGSVTYWGLFDAPSGGNLLIFGPLISNGVPTPRSIGANRTVRFPANSITYRED